MANVINAKNKLLLTAHDAITPTPNRVEYLLLENVITFIPIWNKKIRMTYEEKISMDNLGLNNKMSIIVVNNVRKKLW